MFSIQQLDAFPSDPGVYLMKNKEGKVLYIGKAKNLKKRLKQYFGNTQDTRAMVPFLVKQISEIDTLITLSEKEALLLENTLIKKHQPKFNAVLKDDKTFFSLQINPQAFWPKLQLVRFRNTQTPGTEVFGPYTSSLAAKTTYELLLRLFPLRQCSDEEFKRRTRPCLLYSLKKCPAPCVGKCTKEEYDLFVQGALQFLKGEDTQILEKLYETMKTASDNLEFEKAASLLHTIRQIEEVLSSHSLVSTASMTNRDVIGIYREGTATVIAQLLFRKGSLIGSESYPFDSVLEEEETLLSSFLLQAYTSSTFLPDEILLPFPLEQKELLAEILSTKRKKLVLLAPQKGDRLALINLANINAKSSFVKRKEKIETQEHHLQTLQSLCKLTNYPETIACLDTSHIAGSNSVASIITFTHGEKDRKKTRFFKLKQTKAGDDYGALKEVLIRYLARAKKEDTLPNLIILDGGKGQLHTALSLFEELDIIHIDLIALTKEQGRHDKGLTEERIFLPHHHDPIQLNRRSSLLFFLQNIRDEAHRTALNFHQKQRTKRYLTSSLDQIPGIGAVKRTRLLKHFGSMERIRQASREELREVKGISDRDIEQIKDFKHLGT